MSFTSCRGASQQTVQKSRQQLDGLMSLERKKLQKEINRMDNFPEELRKMSSTARAGYAQLLKTVENEQRHLKTQGKLDTMGDTVCGPTDVSNWIHVFQTMKTDHERHLNLAVLNYCKRLDERRTCNSEVCQTQRGFFGRKKCVVRRT